MKTVTSIHYVRPLGMAGSSHLVLCDDDQLYVVKPGSDSKRIRTNVCEYLFTRLAQSIGLPVQDCAIVRVISPEGPHDRVCFAGLHFGSHHPKHQTVFNSMPQSRLETVSNTQAFAGMLLLDTWCANNSPRTAIFCRDGESERYRASFISHSGAFSGHRWKLNEPQELSRYRHPEVYGFITGPESFEPVASGLVGLRPETLWKALSEMPPEWSSKDRRELDELLDMILTQRSMARKITLYLQNREPALFPLWLPATRATPKRHRESFGWNWDPLTT